jgi:hypothetical protein
VKEGLLINEQSMEWIRRDKDKTICGIAIMTQSDISISATSIKTVFWLLWIGRRSIT